MSLLNKASLIQIPSGYKDGTLYSAKPTNGDGDFTFSRGSNLAATRVNSDGLIEKGRENLLLQSNTFDTTWASTRLFSLTDGQTGYDGSSDAWLMIPNNSSNTHYFNQNVSAGTGVMTASIYAKGGGYDYFAIRDDSNNSYARFDLSLGVTSITGTNAITSSIESVGNGWYRCSLTFTETASGNLLFYINDAYDYVGSYIGDEVSGVYFQDAQLELGLVATDVITTTTTTAQAGILEDMPRLDYSGGATCGHLLLEPQRSNLFEHSEYFGSSDWSKGNVLLTTNSSQSPEGVNNATLMYPTATPSGFAYLYNTTSGSSARYTISAFVKADGKDVCWLYIQGVSAYGIVYFDLSDESIQVVAGSSSTPTGTIEEVNNGWYRITFTLGEDLAISSGSGIGVSDAKGSTSVTQNGEDGILVYGLQIESGSYATSYIPTYGASVTRGADSCTNADVSSLLGSGVGTAFIDMVVNGQDTQGNIPLTIGTGTSNLIYLWIQTSQTIRYEAYTGGTLEGAVNTASGFYTYGDRIKVALVWADNDFAMYINGTQIGTDTSGTAPTPTKLWLGEYTSGNYKGGSINQAILFPTRLSNNELATLTTL